MSVSPSPAAPQEFIPAPAVEARSPFATGIAPQHPDHRGFVLPPENAGLCDYCPQWSAALAHIWREDLDPDPAENPPLPLSHS